MRAGTIRIALRGVVGKFALDAAFATPARGVTALFGASGCGKTTVLRCIAGLHRIADGHVEIDGEIWQDGRIFQPAHERSIGYVFQEASLFQHLSVRRNLLFGARGRRSSIASKEFSFDAIVDLLGIAPLLARAPHNLSGGERQRVAIGRALLSQPRLLLMDEPLSALDRQTKDEILPFLERVQGAFSIPIIYVSHDMSEVERLADHLVLMQAGRVLAAGPLGALQSDPALPLATARDASVTLLGTVGEYDPAYGLLEIKVAGGAFVVPSKRVAAGEPRRLRISASDVSLAIDPVPASTILNALPGRILSASPATENEMLAVIRLGDDESGSRLLARITRRSWDALRLREGMGVTVQVKSVALASPETQTAIRPADSDEALRVQAEPLRS